MGHSELPDRGHAGHEGVAGATVLAHTSLDRWTILFALGLGFVFFALGVFCLALPRFDSALASIWVPNAVAVGALLLVRLRSEIPAYGAVFAAGLAANLVSQNPTGSAVLFSIANCVDILLVVTLTRRVWDGPPDMSDLKQVCSFLLFGGVLGPIASGLVVKPVLIAQPDTLFSTWSSWFLADSMGMILTVPVILLVHDAFGKRREFVLPEFVNSFAIVAAALGTILMVFIQSDDPLLFLAPPITMMVAFRLGSLGTALYVPALAAIAIAMTHNGMGPIWLASVTGIGQMYLIQAFVAANFVAGLPVAALLAGRERMANELMEERQELGLLTENITDAVLKLDARGVCTYASPSVLEVLARPPSDLIGFEIAERSRDDARHGIREVIDRLLGGVSDKERITYRRLIDGDAGQPIFIEADCAIITDPDDGAREGIVISARDVTERVELELQLTRARRKAEMAAMAKSEFLANMSHEIRTPMNGVLGFAELMLQDELADDHRRHTEMIVQSGRSMMLLLNDILDLSKIEAGQIVIDQSPFDPAATIAECIALHRPAAQKKGLTLEETGRNAAGTQNSGNWVLTDGLRVRQIVLNLIGNAVKFTETGGVGVSYVLADDQLQITVADSGIGIDSERLTAIFNPFTQAEGSTARRFGGTGLGLAISRQLAELLGGTITVKSTPGVGSRFMVVVPARSVAPERVQPQRFEGAPPLQMPQTARILLVEDHDVNRILATEMLERCGQNVVVAQDGNEAIAMVIDSVIRERPFDLVLMDIQMPGCDGYTATSTIRAEGITAEQLPILALTANAFPEDISAAREAGMQAHLSKPLVFTELVRALERWLPMRIVEAEPAEPSRSFATTTSTADLLAPTHVPALAPHDPLLTGTTRPSTSRQSNDRWTARRRETVEAVRGALANGALARCEEGHEERDSCARLVHKLAGTAAMFGEAELGEQAAALDRALRSNQAGDVCEALAFALLSIADDPVDRRSAQRN
jgi:PAS domain S-box-containing protein